MNFKFICLSVIVACMLVSCSDDDDKTPLYSGSDLSEKASITRDKETKEAVLHVEINGQWSLYTGSSVETINLNEPILTGNTKGEHTINVSTSARSYFQLVTEEGNAVLAERHLPVAGGYNFRDLGGFRTKDGRYTKWGKVFRSDELSSITDEDDKYLSSLPLYSIVDFRSKEEREMSPNIVPASVKGTHELSLSPGNLMEMGAEVIKMTEEEIAEIMKEMNREFVTDDACIKAYRKLFELLQNESDTPLMFHCSAGKDRTGMGAYLFLSALGVDESTILDDYYVSNVYLSDKYAKYIAMMPALKPLFEVKKEYLQSAIDQVKKDHGSVENYLTNVLKVDLAKMKKMYLY